MKTEKPSGVSAWVMRSRQILNVAVLALLVGVVSSSTSSMAPVAQCIPMNNRLAGPLTPLVNEITGGIGGLVPLILTILIVLAMVVGLFKVWRGQEISTIFQVIVSIPLVVLVTIGVMILIGAAYDILNSMC